MSHDNSNKKKLQKPNILRRNPKTLKSINKVIDLSRETLTDPCYLPEIDLKQIGDGSKKVHNMKNSFDLSDANSSDHNMKEIELKEACIFPMHSGSFIFFFYEKCTSIRRFTNHRIVKIFTIYIDC